jgi:hypothetical protein
VEVERVEVVLAPVLATFEADTLTGEATRAVLNTGCSTA